jgi:hypothetical protein
MLRMVLSCSDFSRHSRIALLGAAELALLRQSSRPSGSLKSVIREGWVGWYGVFKSHAPILDIPFQHYPEKK